MNLYNDFNGKTTIPYAKRIATAHTERTDLLPLRFWKAYRLQNARC